MEKLIIPVLVGFMVIMLMQPGLALTGQNLENQLETSGTYLQNMAEEGIPIQRYNDTLSVAWEIFKAQRSGDSPDYTMVERKLDELSNIRKNAYKARDELRALELSLNQADLSNKTAALDMYNRAKAEYESERFEKSLELIDETYEKISELQALETKVRAFYEATSRSLASFFIQFWKEITIVLVIVVAVVVLGYNKVMCKILKNKIKNLESRKKSVKKLIAKTQKKFFEHGGISERDYRIRIDKYGEIVRDVNRRIPLLEEELELRKKRKI